MEDLCDQLKQLGIHSQRLQLKVYALVQGLSTSKHKAAVKFMNAHPEIVSKLVRRFPDHPNTLTWETADKDARATLKRSAQAIMECLDAEYFLFEDMVIFQDHALRLLGDLNQRMTYPKVGDGPNEIVAKWMDLLCNLVCLHLLACRVPQTAALQVYIAAYSSFNGRNPPHSQQIVNFMLAFSSNPIAGLQAEFSHYAPRLRQILGNLVWPVLSQFPSCSEAWKNGLFKVEDGDNVGVHPPQDEVGLCRVFMSRIPDFQKWVVCSCLICPGVLGQADIRSALGAVLSSCMKMQLLHEQCLNVHALFEQKIKPSLEQIYKSMSKGMKNKEKKAELKIATRELVESARLEWEKNGRPQRKADRVFLVRECRLLCSWVEENPRRIAHHLPSLLGFLSITKHEIMCFFHEIGGLSEVPDIPNLVHRHKGMPAAGFDPKEADPVVVCLIDSHVKLHKLLLSYRSLTCALMVENIQSQLKEEIVPEMKKHLRFIKSQGDVAMYLAKLLSKLVAFMRNIPNTSQKPPNGVWVWDDLIEFGDLWRCVLMMVMDRQCLAAGTWLQEGDGSDWFFTVKKVVLQCEQVGNYVNTITNHSSLQEIFYYRPQTQSLLRHSLDAPTMNDANPMSLLHVFSEFLRNDPGSGDPFRPRSETKFTTLAEESSKDLINLVIDTIKRLIVNCLRTMGQNTPKKSEFLSSLDAVGATDSNFWQSMVERGTFDIHWCKLCSLVSSFSRSGDIQVTSGLKFTPETYLKDAVAATYRAELTRQIFRGPLLQPPSTLKEGNEKFIRLAKTLQAYTSCNLLRPLHHVRASLVGSPTSSQQCGPALVPSIADWYTSNFIRDERGLGIMFCPGKRCFVASVSGEEASTIAVCGKLPEFRSLVAVFGTEGVRQMELHWRSEVTGTIQKLESAVRVNRQVLQGLSGLKGDIIPSNPNYAAQIKDMKGIMSVVQKLARVLALRQLLSEAYCSMLDDVSDGEFKGKAGSRDSWRLNNLGLPGPGYGSDASPMTADPVLVECVGEARMFENGIHHLSLCVKALALAMEAATQTRFRSNDDSVTSASDFLKCFVNVAASVILNKTEPAAIMNCRYLFMDTLCCRQLTKDDLEDLGFPQTRLRTAHESSVVAVASGD